MQAHTPVVTYQRPCALDETEHEETSYFLIIIAVCSLLFTAVVNPSAWTVYLMCSAIIALSCLKLIFRLGLKKWRLGGFMIGVTWSLIAAFRIFVLYRDPSCASIADSVVSEEHAYSQSYFCGSIQTTRTMPLGTISGLFGRITVIPLLFRLGLRRTLILAVLQIVFLVIFSLAFPPLTDVDRTKRHHEWFIVFVMAVVAFENSRKELKRTRACNGTIQHLWKKRRERKAERVMSHHIKNMLAESMATLVLFLDANSPVSIPDLERTFAAPLPRVLQSLRSPRRSAASAGCESCVGSTKENREKPSSSPPSAMIQATMGQSGTTFMNDILSAAVSAAIALILTVIVGSPFYTSGYVFSDDGRMSLTYGYKDLGVDFIVTEVETNHAAVYHGHSALLDTWVVLVVFCNLVMGAFSLFNFAIFFVSDFVGITPIGTLRRTVKLLLMPMIVPGLLAVAGYISWVLAYIGIADPQLLVSVTDYIPKFVAFAEEEGQIPLTELAKEHFMYGLYAPLGGIVLSFAVTPWLVRTKKLILLSGDRHSPKAKML